MSNVKVKAPKKPVKPVIVVIYILLVILAVIYLAPLLWMLSVSLKDNAGVMSAPFSCQEKCSRLLPLMVAESTDAFSGSHCHFAEPASSYPV